ncbi:hypothetical protein EXS70_03040 [Candidatus Peribacteria bacterium]|nr:hypothetical protein [Candidatus Peribacteria bacterium]
MVTFREILDEGRQRRGETTPAMELIDGYRQQLDLLKFLLDKNGTSGGEIFKVAKKLDDMQAEFRLEYLLTTGKLERHPMADLVQETVALLTESSVSFPHKLKILTNSHSREPIIRSGKESKE